MATHERPGLIGASEKIVKAVTDQADTDTESFLWDYAPQMAADNPYLNSSVLGLAVIKYGVDHSLTFERLKGLAVTQRCFELQALSEGRVMPKVRSVTAASWGAEFARINDRIYHAPTKANRESAFQAFREMGKKNLQLITETSPALDKYIGGKDEVMTGAALAYGLFSLEEAPFDPLENEIQPLTDGQIPTITSAITTEALLKSVINRPRLTDETWQDLKDSNPAVPAALDNSHMEFSADDFKFFSSYVAFCVQRAYQREGLPVPIISPETYSSAYAEIRQSMEAHPELTGGSMIKDAWDTWYVETRERHPTLNPTFNILLTGIVPVNDPDDKRRVSRASAALFGFTEVYRAFRNQALSDSLGKLL